MALPGFTADASVGPTTQIYRVQDRYGTAAAADVYPQQLDEGLEDQDLENEDLEDEEVMEMAGAEDAELGDEG